MRIKGAATIAEYKKMQREQIQNWVDRTFIEGSVTWKFDGALHIKVTDKTGDSIIVALQDVD